MADQPNIAGQAEQVVDGVGFAPGHQLLTGEAGIGAQHDADLGPTLTQLAHDALDLLNRAGGRVDVGGPQLGAQKVIAAEDVERQVAVVAVVAVEEPPLLVAVQGIVRGIQIQHDLFGRSGVRAHEQLDEQRLDRHRIVADLVIARRLRPAQL